MRFLIVQAWGAGVRRRRVPFTQPCPAVAASCGIGCGNARPLIYDDGVDEREPPEPPERADAA